MDGVGLDVVVGWELLVSNLVVSSGESGVEALVGHHIQGRALLLVTVGGRLFLHFI